MRLLKPFLLTAAVLFLFFFLADKIPLWSSDEGRYGEIAREMWESGDFVLSRFNYIDYLEKPVLAPALSALACGLFGVNALSVRLVPILSAFAGILMTFLFTRKLFSERTAVYAVLVLSTTVGYVLVGRFAVIDMLMTFFLSASLLFLLTANLRHKGRYYLAAYACMGFAFLTKGLIGIVLPGLVYFAFLMWTKNFKEIKNMKLIWGLVIISAIILPWWLQVTAREPEFFNRFIIEQHFTRFATGSFGRKKPFWFFVPILFAASFPWSLFLPAAVINGLRREGAKRRQIQYLICWIAVILIFFSLPKSKLPYYLLPVSVAVAILTADFLAVWIKRGKNLPGLDPRAMRWSWNGLLAICLLGGIGLSVFLFIWQRDDEIRLLKPVLYPISLLLAAGGLAAYAFMKKAKRKQAVFCLAGMIYAALIFTFAGMQKITPFQSSFDFAQALRPVLQPGDLVSVFASPDTFSDFPFHLRRRIGVVGSDRGTLKEESQKPGHRKDVEGWFFDTKQFVALFNQKTRRIFCLMEKKRISDLQNQGLRDYRVVKEGYKKLLISNESSHETERPYERFIDQAVLGINTRPSENRYEERH